MSGGPAGACEWCGGPQQWTQHAGEILVRCVSGCLPLFEVVVPPPDGFPEREDWMFVDGGTFEREGVVPLEGGAANGSEEDQPEPADGPALPF